MVITTTRAIYAPTLVAAIQTLSMSRVEYITQYKTVYTVSKKNDTDVAHYNFNAHKPSLVVIRRDIAERISY